MHSVRVKRACVSIWNPLHAARLTGGRRRPAWWPGFGDGALRIQQHPKDGEFVSGRSKVSRLCHQISRVQQPEGPVWPLRTQSRCCPEHCSVCERPRPAARWSPSSPVLENSHSALVCKRRQAPWSITSCCLSAPGAPSGRKWTWPCRGLHLRGCGGSALLCPCGPEGSEAGAPTRGRRVGQGSSPNSRAAVLDGTNPTVTLRWVRVLLLSSARARGGLP